MPTDPTRKETTRRLRGLQSRLYAAGSVGTHAVRYLKKHRVRISLRFQSAGARWTIDRRIELNPRYAPESGLSAYGLSLVIHEVRHLQQGPLTALSVYGELDAWQVQFGFLNQQSVEIPGSESQKAAIEQLLALPGGWNRDGLRTARRLMREYGGRAYRIDLLPLYPIHREIAFLITRHVPGQS